MSFYSIAVLSFFVFFCHIMINIHQDDVSDSKVIKKKKIPVAGSLYSFSFL